MKTLIATVLGEVREVEKFYENGDFLCPYCNYPVSEICSNPACPSTFTNPDNLKKYYDAQEKLKQEELERQKILNLQNRSYGRK